MYLLLLWRGTTFLGPNGTRFARAISGPKKSRFSGPTPSNAPSNDVAALKPLSISTIKTTGTLVVLCTRVLLCTVVVLLCVVVCCYVEEGWGGLLAAVLCVL